MELKYEILPLEVKEWFQEPDHLKFLNIQQTDNGLQYGLQISSYNHQESDFYIFDVMMEKVVKTVTNLVNLKAVAVARFKIKLEKNIIPEPKLYFLFIETGTKQFVNEYYERTRETIHYARRIPIPVFDELKDQIQTYIDNWDKNVRFAALN